MNRLKMLATTAAAATTIGVGGLVASPSASAMPMPCARAMALADAYEVIGQMLYNNEDYEGASYYFGLARGVLYASC